LTGNNFEYLSREGFKPDRDSNQSCFEVFLFAHTTIAKLFVVNGAEEKGILVMVQSGPKNSKEKKP